LNLGIKALYKETIKKALNLEVVGRPPKEQMEQHKYFKLDMEMQHIPFVGLLQDT
jgi:hypothetical protein